MIYEETFHITVNQKETKVKDRIGMHLFLIDLRGHETTLICANINSNSTCSNVKKSNVSMSQLHNDDAIKVSVHLNEEKHFSKIS